MGAVLRAIGFVVSVALRFAPAACCERASEKRRFGAVPLRSAANEILHQLQKRGQAARLEEAHGPRCVVHLGFNPSKHARTFLQCNIRMRRETLLRGVAAQLYGCSQALARPRWC